MMQAHFISWTEAQQRVLANTPLLSEELVPVELAGGRMLSRSLDSPVDMPPFDNSAMDGYALAWSDPLPSSWKVIGEIPAGSWPTQTVGPGQAMRIFTGAPIPPGADTVIQQEWIEANGDTIRMTSGILKQGANIRGKATQIRNGEEALGVRTLMTPGAIGFLANLGLPTVPVYRRPVVDILVTGSELVKPGQDLPPGHIYESNSHTLIAALLAEGITPRQVSHVRDDLDTFRDQFQEAVKGADMILITGGISVGDHDIVRQVFEEGGVHPHFYKVKQRPGKPLFFGQTGSTLVFALPGNPASVTSCFYQYVYPGLRKMQGFPSVFLESVRLPLKADFTKKAGLTFFLKALVEDGGVMPLSGQLSYIMRSFAPANAVIMLEEDRTEYKVGEIVDVHLLGHGRA